ncbi:hypothetical protein [Labilibaculum euxinus]
MTNKIKITIAFLCLVAGVTYHFYFQGKIVIIDEEITDFLSGFLSGIGVSILLVGIFRKDKKQLASGSEQ